MREAISNSEAALAVGVTPTSELIYGIKDGNVSPWAPVLKQLVEASGTNGVGKRIVEGKLARGLAQVNLKLAAYAAEKAGEDVNQQMNYWVAGEEEAARMLGKHVEQMTLDEKKALRRGEVGIVIDAAVQAKFGEGGWDGFYRQTIDPLVRVENGPVSGVDSVDGFVVRKDAGSSKPENGVGKVWQYATIALAVVGVAALAAGAAYAEQGVNGGGKPTDSCEVDPLATPGMGDEKGGGCPPSDPNPNGCFHGEPDCTETPAPPTETPELPPASNTPEPAATTAASGTPGASSTIAPTAISTEIPPTPLATVFSTATAWLTQVFTPTPRKTATPVESATVAPTEEKRTTQEAILTVAPGTTQVLSNTLVVDRGNQLPGGEEVVFNCEDYQCCPADPALIAIQSGIATSEADQAESLRRMAVAAENEVVILGTQTALMKVQLPAATTEPKGGSDGSKNKDVSPWVPVGVAVAAALTMFGLVRNRKGQVQPAEGFGDAQGQREG